MNFKHKGKAELRITRDTTKKIIESWQTGKERRTAKCEENGKKFGRTITKIFTSRIMIGLLKTYSMPFNESTKNIAKSSVKLMRKRKLHYKYLCAEPRKFCKRNPFTFWIILKNLSVKSTQLQTPNCALIHCTVWFRDVGPQFSAESRES